VPDDDLQSRLTAVHERFAEIDRALAEPALAADQVRLRDLMRERAKLAPTQEKAAERAVVGADLDAARTMLAEADADSRGWIRDEVVRLEARLAELEGEIRILLLPRDPRDDRGVVVEVRAGAGGDEAALFAADLVRMYARYAERRGWKAEMLNSSETGIGGFKEVSLGIEGESVYSRLRFESGVHRVQRVPETEASGRIHTSTATVAVMTDADEVELDIRPEDLEIDTYRSSGAGGQHVNRTESAIRITHKPTGMVVTCQDERSQIKNRAKAMKVLRARLYDMQVQERDRQIASDRRAQVGTGERSERIRTYNFPQNRLSEERIDLTLYHLREILDGALDEVLDPLIAEDQARRLRGAEAR